VTPVAWPLSTRLCRAKYDTLDDSYWTRPLKEQEQCYQKALSEVLEHAAENACKKLGLRWNEASVPALCTHEASNQSQP
jgi:hypothetical protein